MYMYMYMYREYPNELRLGEVAVLGACGQHLEHLHQSHLRVRVSGLGCGIWGSEFRFWALVLGFRVQVVGIGFRG